VTDGAKIGERRFAYFLDEEKVRRPPVREPANTLQKYFSSTGSATAVAPIGFSIYQSR